MSLEVVDPIDVDVGIVESISIPADPFVESVVSVNYHSDAEVDHSEFRRVQSADTRSEDPVIPEDVLRLYARIPQRIQELITEAGTEAKMRGDPLDLRVSELESLTHLTHDDVFYANLLTTRGESASAIVNTLLKRAEHLSSVIPTPQTNVPRPLMGGRAVDLNAATVMQVHARGRTTSPSRMASQSVGRPSVASPSVFTAPSMSGTRSSSKPRRSLTPKHPTRAYGTVVTEYSEIRALSRDKSVTGPDTTRYGGVASRPQTMSPPPESVKRCTVVGKLDPNSIAGKMIKASNSGGSMRSRSARIPATKEPVTQVQAYDVPGMADMLKQRGRGNNRVAAFGSSIPTQAASYLPRDVFMKVQQQKREQRRARLTAASTQDASTIIKNARSRKRNPSPPAYVRDLLATPQHRKKSVQSVETFP